jgi:hypothetical protein
MSRDSNADTAINTLSSAAISNSGDIATQTFQSSSNSTVNGTLNTPGGIVGSSSYPEIDLIRMGRYVETYYNYGNQSGTVNIDCSEGNNFRVRLTGNTILNFTNVPNPSTSMYSMSILIDNGSGGLSLSFGSNVKWPGGSTPSRSTGNNDVDIWVFQTYNGSTWYGNLSLLDMN